MNDPFTCGNCGHSFDMHNTEYNGGCRVKSIETGKRCECKKFVQRTSRRQTSQKRQGGRNEYSIYRITPAEKNETPEK